MIPCNEFFRANGTALSQPRVEQSEACEPERNPGKPATAIPESQGDGPKKGAFNHASIPDISFVDLKAMSHAQFPEFVLKREPPMLLIFNVLNTPLMSGAWIHAP